MNNLSTFWQQFWVFYLECAVIVVQNNIWISFVLFCFELCFKRVFCVFFKGFGGVFPKLCNLMVNYNSFIYHFSATKGIFCLIMLESFFLFLLLPNLVRRVNFYFYFFPFKIGKYCWLIILWNLCKWFIEFQCMRSTVSLYAGLVIWMSTNIVVFFNICDIVF